VEGKLKAARCLNLGTLQNGESGSERLDGIIGQPSAPVNGTQARPRPGH